MLITAEQHAPCRIYDANGLEWKHLRWVNTETGEAERIVKTLDGGYVVDERSHSILTEIIHIAAPVLMQPMRWEEQS